LKAYNGFSPAQRNKAQRWLNAEWAAGTLPKPNHCYACGQDKGVIDAHAEDYSEPFAAGKTDEYHLCFRCHMMVHCRFSNPAAWTQYKLEVARGVVFAPINGRNFPAFKAQHLDDWAPEIERVRESPGYLPLDDID